MEIKRIKNNKPVLGGEERKGGLFTSPKLLPERSALLMDDRK
jgi:hypothetical protein